MSHPIGIWIDHRDAVLVEFDESGETVTRIEANLDKRARYSGGASAHGAHASRIGKGEAAVERRRDEQLRRYYDDVIAQVRHSEALFIYGPGEAKLELVRRLRGYGLDEQVVSVETVDRWTPERLTSDVRARLQHH